MQVPSVSLHDAAASQTPKSSDTLILKSLILDKSNSFDLILHTTRTPAMLLTGRYAEAHVRIVLLQDLFRLQLLLIELSTRGKVSTAAKAPSKFRISNRVSSGDRQCSRNDITTYAAYWIRTMIFTNGRVHNRRCLTSGHEVVNRWEEEPNRIKPQKGRPRSVTTFTQR